MMRRLLADDPDAQLLLTLQVALLPHHGPMFLLSLELIEESFRPKRCLNPAVEDENDPVITILETLSG